MVARTNQKPIDLDIYRAANLLIERYDEDAPIHAAMRADAMMAKGDLAAPSCVRSWGRDWGCRLRQGREGDR